MVTEIQLFESTNKNIVNDNKERQITYRYFYFNFRLMFK